MRKFGYVRISTKDQNIDRQIDALKEYGIAENDIFIDRLSGKDFNRPEYQLLKNRILRDGDVLVIKELDRLGRDMEEIKNEWRDIEANNINIEVLDMPIINTTGKDTLERSLISNIVFELLCYMAQKEREKIRQRQAEGIASMKVGEDGKLISNKTGRATGRPVVEMPEDFRGVYDRVFVTKEITALKGMEELGLKKSTFYRFKKLVDEERGL